MILFFSRALPTVILVQANPSRVCADASRRVPFCGPRLRYITRHNPVYGDQPRNSTHNHAQLNTKARDQRARDKDQPTGSSLQRINSRFCSFDLVSFDLIITSIAPPLASRRLGITRSWILGCVSPKAIILFCFVPDQCGSMRWIEKSGDKRKRVEGASLELNPTHLD